MGLRSFFYKLSGDRERSVSRKGIQYRVRASDCIGLAILKKGCWEKPQTDYFTNLCSQAKVDYFFDMGAYFGYYSVWLATNLNLKQCFAFEPSPESFEKLNTHISINGLEDKIKSFNLALSDSDKDEVSFWLHSDKNPGGSTLVKNNSQYAESYKKSVKVKSQRLENMDCAQKTGQTIAAKIDTEGHEIEALNGAIEFFKKNNTVLQVESFEHIKEELFDILTKANFHHIHTIDNDHYFKNF